MKKLHNYGTFNNDLYEVKIRDENNLNKNLGTRYVNANRLLKERRNWNKCINKKLIEWSSKTEQEINCEIKEAEYKLDCEKKHIEYHPIQHV
ncbi:hypothetical protein [Spiroplasma endosymbiont of Danaus chrysippus]|uniref:hypothetical protein n=1 Tax=Spiroplasma endosymbiont of Danaus chrysippus TaxID=2691041 RepID=UPI00157A21A1|nr:hypothetical protein [Spiroplasma endosymbiont of Danaus chrysippus]